MEFFKPEYLITLFGILLVWIVGDIHKAVSSIERDFGMLVAYAARLDEIATRTEEIEAKVAQVADDIEKLRKQYIE